MREINLIFGTLISGCLAAFFGFAFAGWLNWPLGFAIGTAVFLGLGVAWLSYRLRGEPIGEIFNDVAEFSGVRFFTPTQLGEKTAMLPDRGMPLAYRSQGHLFPQNIHS